MIENTAIVLACELCRSRPSMSLFRCKHCGWFGCAHVVDRSDNECTPHTDLCRDYAAERAKQKAIDELRASGVCVTPNGRTDCHLRYAKYDASGKLVCAFCLKPPDFETKPKPRRRP